MESTGNEENAHTMRPSKRGEDDAGPSLNINSMMDMMVIILAFLLMSIGSDPLNVTQGDDLRLVNSTTTIAPMDSMTITISQKQILVGDEVAVLLNANQEVDPGELENPESLFIDSLFTRVSNMMDERAALRQAEQSAGVGEGDSDETVATLIVDRTTPYLLINQVMHTANKAEVDSFRFAIVRRSQGQGVSVDTE